MTRTRSALLVLSALSSVPVLLHCGGDPSGVGAHAPASSNSQVASATAAATASSASASSGAKPPPTPKKPVVDTYFGTQVTDDYRWLEDPADPAVRGWSDAQNAYTRAALDALPDRAAIRARVSELLQASSPDWFNLAHAGKTLFALKDQPPKQQPYLITLPDENGAERVLLDPNVVDATGKTTIDWYVPSLDGKLMAVSLSKGGSESGDVHVYEVATGKERTGEEIARVNGGTAGGSLAWNGDGSGFWYTRYPRDGERPVADLGFYQQVYFHKLGTKPETDAYSIGKDFPKIAEVELVTSEDGNATLARVANGDGGEYAFYLLTKGAKEWKPIAAFADKVIHARFGRDGSLYLISRSGAPKGKVLKLPVAAPVLAKATVVVPESEAVIDDLMPTKSRLYVLDLVGGPSQLRVFDLAGKALSPVPILPVSAVRQIVRLDGDDLIYRNGSFVEPPAFYRFDSKAGTSKKTPLAYVSPVDFADSEVVRETCTSKDGTKVPLSIVRKKGTVLDGNGMTLLSGYGGYGVNIMPRYDVARRVWLDQGGVYAVANLRGGGEFGEAWHLAGNLTNKQHVFDDFLGCAQLLIDEKYTRAGHLAIEGGSNGGLLMGAALTQRPDLFGVVVTHVGLYDMLRVELNPNGAFNTTEFGSVKDKPLFDALYAYSPYHRVKDGAAYPPSLFLTGANDPRVNPYESRKMVARLQAATSSNAPIFLRTSTDTGHGGGTPLAARIDQDVDVYGFLFSELGHRYTAVAASTPTTK